MHTGRLVIASPLSLPFWPQPINPRGLFHNNDSSHTPSLSLSIVSCSTGIPGWVPSYRLFTPLYGLRTSRYRRGDAVTPASGERDSHPHEYLVVKGVSPLCHPSLISQSIRVNESHKWSYVKRHKAFSVLIQLISKAITSLKGSPNSRSINQYHPQRYRINGIGPAVLN
ncbi:hypothetical protein BH09BAC4_BH09BAC4_07270 [soil metagenome]